MGNHRVQVFDNRGRFLRKWGTEGSGDGQFIRPDDLALDEEDNVYVTDGSNHRVQVFDSRGRFLRKWGTEGSGDGQFNGPYLLALDGGDNVYVGDKNLRIQVFDSQGRFLRKWGTEGSGAGQFNIHGLLALALDREGNVYVTDAENQRIQVFKPDTSIPPRKRPG